MDNKAYFMTLHNRLKNSNTLKGGDLSPNQQESDNYKKSRRTKIQDEFFEKQKNEVLTPTK